MDKPFPTLIGDYGPWAGSLVKRVPALSFRNDRFSDVEAWKNEALAKVKELLYMPDLGPLPKVTVQKRYAYDGLDMEEISWQLPNGRPTNALVIKPSVAREKLPGLLALHDHAAIKYFGKEKITQTSGTQHPVVEAHQQSDYGGLAWANEVARRGYVVLVHDVFAFGSRRVQYKDMLPVEDSFLDTKEKEELPATIENIRAYNEWAGHHEHVMAKSLFCAGTTWPGVFLAEDKMALDILAAREDVDADRLGCGGLSGGGLRTVMLGGTDDRIKCAVSAGFMSTWDDFLLYKSITHTWMLYIPGLPNFLDFPEIFGLRVPLPSMVLNNNEDPLYTLPEMKKADSILRDIYRKAGAEDRYNCRYYPGPHKMDGEMQQDAFDWFDQWLKA
ncbi:MAG: prolyl oligopeptidase family serine peptidase [Cyclobacteriaceae bacterium]|nr:prolyl oligopeptidase family serine peptidase [Cyclobacteriaceae bacterium]